MEKFVSVFKSMEFMQTILNYLYFPFTVQTDKWNKCILSKSHDRLFLRIAWIFLFFFTLISLRNVFIFLQTWTDIKKVLKQIRRKKFTVQTNIRTKRNLCVCVCVLKKHWRKFLSKYKKVTSEEKKENCSRVFVVKKKEETEKHMKEN